MDPQTFEHKLRQAQTLQRLSDTHGQHFWLGYQRGLRRHYYGEKFGTQEEHLKWMDLADSALPELCEAGRGYRAGFMGLDPDVRE